MAWLSFGSIQMEMKEGEGKMTLQSVVTSGVDGNETGQRRRTFGAKALSRSAEENG